MAEAMLRLKVGLAFDIYSAGTEPRPIHPMTLEVLQECGADIQPLTSKSLSDLTGLDRILFVIIVCSNAEQACPDTFAQAAVRLVWPFDDPSATRGSAEDALMAFRRTREQISKRLDAWLENEIPREWLAQRSVQ